MNMIRLILFIAAVGTASVVSAGIVQQAIILAVPVMQVKDGAVQGCGYRLKAIPKDFAGQASFVALDISFNLYSSGLGLVKGGAQHIVLKDGNPRSTNGQAESFWLKVEGDKPTTAAEGKVLQSPDTGYLLYEVSVEAISKLFAGLLRGSPMTLGVRVKGEPIDRIYSGSVQVSEQDKRQGGECLREVIK